MNLAWDIRTHVSVFQSVNRHYRISCIHNKPVSPPHCSHRWLLLWYYGGVYLDLDVVVKRPLTELPNCTGLESGQWASAGVLKFTPAHPLIRECLDHFAAHFDGRVWGANGPKLLTRVLTKRWVVVFRRVLKILTLAFSLLCMGNFGLTLSERRKKSYLCNFR